MRKQSEEAKNKISLKNSKAINAYKDNKFVDEYLSITEAAEKLNLHRQNIQKELKNIIYSTGGFKFEYKK